jgi:hypothetical protein
MEKLRDSPVTCVEQLRNIAKPQTEVEAVTTEYQTQNLQNIITAFYYYSYLLFSISLIL